MSQVQNCHGHWNRSLGFPGVPLKIAFSGGGGCLWFPRQTVKIPGETFELLSNLTGISAIHGRAEEYAKTNPTEKYDPLRIGAGIRAWQPYPNTVSHVPKSEEFCVL